MLNVRNGQSQTINIFPQIALHTFMEFSNRFFSKKNIEGSDIIACSQ